MREQPSREQQIVIAKELGAVPYSPAPMRAIKGVSFTFEQLDAFVAKILNPNHIHLDNSERTAALWPKEAGGGDDEQH